MYSTIPKNNHDKLNTILYSIAYFNEAVWDYYDIESLRNKKVTHVIRSHRITFLPPFATFKSQFLSALSKIFYKKSSCILFY